MCVFVSPFTYSGAPFLHTRNPPAILVSWPENVGDTMTSVYGLFSQVFTILLATTASIGREKLTLFEAHFAIAVTASPISCLSSYLRCLAKSLLPSQYLDGHQSNCCSLAFPYPPHFLAQPKHRHILLHIGILQQLLM